MLGGVRSLITGGQFHSEDQSPVDLLRTAVSRQAKRTDQVAGTSIASVIDQLFDNKDYVAIEALLPCMLEDGEIPSLLSQKMIGALLASNTDYDFAARLRQAARSLLLNQCAGANSPKNPHLARLMLGAGASLGDEADTLPPNVAALLHKFGNSCYLPLWWLATPPKDGVFHAEHLEQIAIDFAITDQVVGKFKVKCDEVYAWRIQLALKTKALYWLKKATPAEVSQEAARKGLDTFIDRPAYTDQDPRVVPFPMGFFTCQAPDPEVERVLDEVNDNDKGDRFTLDTSGIIQILRSNLSWEQYQAVNQRLPHRERSMQRPHDITFKFSPPQPKSSKALLLLSYCQLTTGSPVFSTKTPAHAPEKGDYDTTLGASIVEGINTSLSMAGGFFYAINTALDRAIKYITPIGADAMPINSKSTDNTEDWATPGNMLAWLRVTLRSMKQRFTQNSYVSNAIQAALDGKAKTFLADDGFTIGIQTSRGAVLLPFNVGAVDYIKNLPENLSPDPIEIQLSKVAPHWTNGLKEKVKQEIFTIPEFLVEQITLESNKSAPQEPFSSQTLQALEKHLAKSVGPNHIYLELSPINYLKQKIQTEITAYEKKHKTNLNLTSDSNILITTHEHIPGPYLSGPTKQTRYHNVQLSIFLSGGTDLIMGALVLHFESEHLERFAMGAREKLRKLGPEMHQNVEKIRSTPDLRAGLHNAYTGNIVSHCLQLLNESGIDTESKNIITGFLNGELKASVISINGAPVSNVFLLGKTSSLTLFQPYYDKYEDVPEGLFVSLNSKNTYRFSINRSGHASSSGYHHHFDNPKFKELLCENVSIRDYKRCSDNLSLHSSESNPLGLRRKKFSTIRIMRRHRTPLKFKETSGLQELAGALTDNTLTNTDSNVDVLFYSRREHNTDLALAVFKHILATVSIPVALISMLPFGLAGTIGAAAANSLIGGSIIGIDTYRYIQDKGTEREKEALSNLVMSSIFGLISGSAVFRLLKTKDLISIYAKIKPSISKITKGISKAAGTKTNKANMKQPKAPIVNTPIEHEPIREIILPQPDVKLPPTLSNYRSDIDKIPSLSEMVNKPKENCFNILDETTNYMIGKGMTDIKVRGMYIWQKPDDIMPSNHYVLLGKMDGVEYVFDLTAGQFPKIDGPLVLPKLAWERIYQQTWPSKLIKYSDFSTKGRAEFAFSSSQPMNPVEFMKDATILAKPNWYLKGMPLN